MADGSHRVVGHGGDEHGEQLVGAGLERQTLVILRAGENLGHRVFALKISQ